MTDSPAPDRPSLRKLISESIWDYTEAVDTDYGIPVVKGQEKATDVIMSRIADYLTGAAPEKDTSTADDWNKVKPPRISGYGLGNAEGRNAAIDEYTANIKHLLGGEK